MSKSDRTFKPEDAKGGCDVVPKKTACVFIEYQNEFTTEGGKLHDAVKSVMESTKMLTNSVDVATVARKMGVTIIHAPISFKPDHSDNPNCKLGILAGCKDGSLFVEDTWNAQICDQMKPKDGDLIVKGKKGLDAFPNTDLEALLVSKGIETVVLGGFLTNCCVESTMRTAYEKGFNVITLTDCTGATSDEAQKAATNGTYAMFSSPMTKDEFLTKLN